MKIVESKLIRACIYVGFVVLVASISMESYAGKRKYENPAGQEQGSSSKKQKETEEKEKETEGRSTLGEQSSGIQYTRQGDSSDAHGPVAEGAQSD